MQARGDEVFHSVQYDDETLEHDLRTLTGGSRFDAPHRHSLSSLSGAHDADNCVESWEVVAKGEPAETFDEASDSEDGDDEDDEGDQHAGSGQAGRGAQ